MKHHHAMAKILRAGIVILIFSGLYACTSPKQEQPEFELKPSSYKKLPGWNNDDMRPALHAFQHSCGALLRKPDEKFISPHQFAGKAKNWKPICQAAKEIDAHDEVAAKAFFEAWFTPVEVKKSDKKPGLFTGYFEPTVYASKTRHDEYQYPIYAKPRDLVDVDLGKFQNQYVGRTITGKMDRSGKRLLPYHTREEINNGALKDQNLEILWVNNRIDRFFLEIQGSGRAVLDNGEEVRVLYDGKNGRSYTAIGKVLLDKGYLPKGKVSMQSIREFLEKNPDKMDEILNANKSFVFFRLGKKPHIYGSQNVPLTAERSLAVDKHYLPLGVPVWLNTHMPADHNPAKSSPMQRLMIAQDTGGAITGPIRGDIFWGHGQTAATKAGNMKYKGHYWLLLPKDVTV